MRAIITQQMDNSEELRSKLKLAESELVAAWKALDEVVMSLRMTEGERKATNSEARQLRKKGKTVEAKCKETKQEDERLRNEVEEIRAGFATQKEKLEGEHQK